MNTGTTVFFSAYGFRACLWVSQMCRAIRR